MLGRTNTNLYGDVLVVDGNTIDGIVADADGIVSGDFVQEEITSVSLKSVRDVTNSPYIFTFSLADGSIASFFNSSIGFGFWNYKYENDNVVDLGFHLVEGVSRFWARAAMHEIEPNRYALFVRMTNAIRAYVITLDLPNTSVVTTDIADVAKAELMPNSILKFDESRYILSTFYKPGLSNYKIVILIFNVNEDGTIEVLRSNETIDYFDFSSGILITSERRYNGKPFIKISDTEIAFFPAPNQVIIYEVKQDSSVEKKILYSLDFNCYSPVLVYDNNLVVIDTHTTSTRGLICVRTIQLSSSFCIVSDRIVLNEFKLGIYNVLNSIYNFDGKWFILSLCWKYYSSDSNYVDYQYYISTFDPDNLTKVDSVYVFEIPKISRSQGVDKAGGELSILKENMLYLLSYYYKDNGYLTGTGVTLSEVANTCVEYSEGNIATIDSVRRFRKVSSAISGIAKQSGAQGDVISVYVPKT